MTSKNNGRKKVQRTLNEAARCLFFNGHCDYRGLVKVRRTTGVVQSITHAKELIRAALARKGRSVPVGRPAQP